jgi:hypothetical protein
MEVVALKRRVFLRIVAKMSDRYLEQRINVNFLSKIITRDETWHFEHDIKRNNKD